MRRWDVHGDVDGKDASRAGGASVVAGVVARGRAFDVAVAVAQSPRRQQGGQHGLADHPDPVNGAELTALGGVVAGGINALRGDELVAGSVQGGGEAGTVRVQAGAGLDRLDHGRAQQLIKRQQRPDLLLDSGAVPGAQDMPIEHGVAQREVSGLDLPAFVVEPDQLLAGNRRSSSRVVINR